MFHNNTHIYIYIYYVYIYINTMLCTDKSFSSRTGLEEDSSAGERTGMPCSVCFCVYFGSLVDLPSYVCQNVRIHERRAVAWR